MSELIIYTATWCGPCKQIKKWLELSNVEYGTNLDKITFVDIDNPNEIIPLGIKSVPTLVDYEIEKSISGANAIIHYLEGKLNGQWLV